MKKEGFKEFLDSDEKFRKGQIAQLQKVKEETAAYEFMMPAEKEKINKTINQVQNYYRNKQMF